MPAWRRRRHHRSPTAPPHRPTRTSTARRRRLRSPQDRSRLSKRSISATSSGRYAPPPRGTYAGGVEQSGSSSGSKTRDRAARASAKRDTQNLSIAWAPQEAILVGSPVKFGEAARRVIPSQVQPASLAGKV